MRLAAVGMMTLAMCLSLMVEAASASAKWGAAITVSALGKVPLGALDNNGILHVNYQWSAPASPGNEELYAQVSPDGRVTRSDSTLDHAIPVSTQDPPSTFTFLGNGDAVRCALKGNLNTTGHLSAFFYSPGGRLIKSARLADAHSIFDGNIEDQCEVVSTGNSAAIVWAVPDDSVSTARQPGRQLLLSRILPGLRLSAPVAVLPAGDDQLTGVETGTPQESIAVTKTGWIALAWPYIQISRETGSSVTEVRQWRARWMSPAGVLGPAVALEQRQDITCRFSGPCDVLDTVFYLGAVANQRTMVVENSTKTWGTLDTAGDVSGFAPLPPGHLTDTYSPLSFGDYKAIATLWSGNPANGHIALAASEWSHGRWSPLHQFATKHGSNWPYVTEPLMSGRGEGAVIWYQYGGAPGSAAGAYAEFDSVGHGTSRVRRR